MYVLNCNNYATINEKKINLHKLGSILTCRKCKLCNHIKDEYYFVVVCYVYRVLRTKKSLILC